MKSDPLRALALTVTPDGDALMIGADAWPQAVDRRTPGLRSWPEAGQQFATVALRLPKSKDELAMTLQLAAAALKPDGTLYVFGANDEGIGSAAKPLHALFAEVETAAIKHHARVYRAKDLKADVALKGRAGDWRRSFTFTADGETFAHVTYPGVFARDRLDAGTALLLTHLPPLQGSVLDFGCGSGPISQVIRARHPEAEITMVDIDAVALQAAVENVPDAWAGQVRTPGDVRSGPFDVIVSNPPLHTGVAQDFSMLRELIDTTPAMLAKGGAVFLVVQSKVPLTRLTPAAQKLADEGGYAVWRR